jgi:hypothetical protein
MAVRVKTGMRSRRRILKRIRVRVSVRMWSSTVKGKRMRMRMRMTMRMEDEDLEKVTDWGKEKGEASANIKDRNVDVAAAKKKEG